MLASTTLQELPSLTFQVLGELEVRRGGELVALPQSKKTRALLAYLVLTNREHRRERLCDLFWDVADDRRGALRWSLSKLRSVVDEEGAERIVADRERVSFVGRGAKVDALELRRVLGSRPIATLETSELETWARAFRGELLEGLDLADFDDYQTWCVGERERARELRTSILEELVRRLEHEPARAVEHARILVSIDPLREPARVALVKLLAALGRRDEARQHFEAARRLEKELGRPPAPALLAAFRDVEPSPRILADEPAAAARELEPASEAPLVGRKRELRVLTNLTARVAADGRLGVVVVSGEPGVGKTRLLHEWMRLVRARGDAALTGASFEAESGRPYGPWIEALADAPGLAREAMLQLCGAGSNRDVPNREDLFARVSAGVADLARRGRVLAMVLDDVQWLDEGSAELLHYVARTNRERPLALALATREGELDDNSALVRVLRGLRRDGIVEELSLGGLRREETHALLAELGVGDDAERVHEQSGGNPLFAIELARNVARGGGVASTLAGIIRDRIAQLPDDAAGTAQWAAVLGTSFGLEKLERVTALDTEVIVRALELLERRAILRRANHGDLVFAHEIVRSIVYTDLSEPRRRLMHRRIAQTLAASAHASGDLVADVAHHAALAGDAALAADACLGAARRSLRVFANADAFALARRGARHAERLDDPERTKRLLELAEVTFAARPPEDADAEAKRLEALAERALDLGCHDHARLGFHLVAFLRWERGVWGDAKKHMLQAELVSRGGSEAERVRGMAEAARCLVLLERDLPHAQALALEAAARGRQVGVEPAAIADALGMLALHRGRVTEAITQLERARSLSRAERDHYGEFQALEHLTMLHVERGDFRSAAARAEQLTELGARFREGSEAPFARALAALATIALGDRTAEEALERELDALTMADAKHRLGYVLARAALLDARSDVLPPRDVVRTRSRAERALAIAEQLARPTEIAFARVALLRTARHVGDEALEAEQRAALAALSPSEVAMSAKALVAHELDDEAWLVSSNLGARS